VTIRFKGKRRPADVQVLTDEPGVVEAYALVARDTTASPNSTRGRLLHVAERDAGVERGGDEPVPKDMWAHLLVQTCAASPAAAA
jgi:hypothetical protein